jgi:hypothetical protein
LCSKKLAYVIINTAFSYYKVIGPFHLATTADLLTLSPDMKTSPMHYWLGLLALLYILPVTAAETENFCQGQTPLEVSYCKLVALGATGLPPLYEFRKNSADTQYLLLKRPAARLGVSLAEPTKTTRRKPEPAIPTAVDEAPRPISSAKAASRARTDIRPASGLNTSGCQLQGETITCANERYSLQWNKPKQALAPGALAASNQLIFAAAPASAAQLDDYLQRCYVEYLQKMLVIGLGNTTLSYGKFANIYAEAKSQNFDFAARFTKMYHFLKEERKTLNPPKGFGQAKPQRIDACLKLSDSIWSCQTADHHWLFAKG